MKRHVEYAGQFFNVPADAWPNSAFTPFAFPSRPYPTKRMGVGDEEDEEMTEVCRHSQRAEEPKTAGDAIT